MALAVALVLVTAGTLPVRAGDGIVRAVLFYSPSCPHCHQVITVDLQAIEAQYGDQFDMALIDVSEPLGRSLYEGAIATFGIEDDRIGVPTMILGDVVLVGSIEIPQRLPGLIEESLAMGGTDWPAIPGLIGLLATPVPGSPVAASASPAIPPGAIAPATLPSPATEGVAPGPAIVDRIARDPLGNAISIGVLIALVLLVAFAAASRWMTRSLAPSGRPSPWIGPLAVTGLAVAAYLAAIELSGSSAVCGPVGDCNAVHTSVYARLLGIPVGLLGVVGYVSILVAWLVADHGRAARRRAARIALVVLAFAGTLFSIYLTFLEPFVIGATCGWCLASAALMGAILVLSSADVGRSVRAPGGTDGAVRHW